MEALRKQAKKLTETVGSAQQAVFNQAQSVFSNIPGVPGASSSSSDAVILDEAELERHKELEFLYAATKSTKHYQREVIRGIEGIINANLKHIEAISRLSDECKKYGSDSPGGEGTVLGRAALMLGSSHAAVERERDMLDRALGTQVGDPLKAMVTGAPLEDARSLTQRYDRLRQEAETLIHEIRRRQGKEEEGAGGPENVRRIRAGQEKMKEMGSTLNIVGKEAASAMTAVAAQQQRQSLQRLIAMVEAEKAFHQSSAGIMDKLLSQLVAERQNPDGAFLGKGYRAAGERASADTPSARGSSNPFDDDAEGAAGEAEGAPPPPPPAYQEVAGEQSRGERAEKQKPNPSSYFLAEVIHPFDADGAGEMSLKAGDYVVVRQVEASGWSEGECRGRAGWFPSDFVERRERVPARKIVDWATAA